MPTLLVPSCIQPEPKPEPPTGHTCFMLLPTTSPELDSHWGPSPVLATLLRTRARPYRSADAGGFLSLGVAERKANGHAIMFHYRMSFCPPHKPRCWVVRVTRTTRKRSPGERATQLAGCRPCSPCSTLEKAEGFIAQSQAANTFVIRISLLRLR